MGIATEETALSKMTEESFELAPTAVAAEKQYEIQSAIIIAKNFPRNEDRAFEKVMRTCQRTSFAEDAAYRFPRGNTQVIGPSVNLAREAARAWGNIRYGLAILSDDDESILLQGWAWDVESNTKITAEDRFKKLIFRKGKGWIKPDERDLRELINRRGAIAVRNCLLQLLPKDLVEDAMTRCEETLRAHAAQDPDAARKKIILAFSEFNVTPEMLEEYLGHPLKQASSEEIVDLRNIYKSIKDGNSKWHEYVNGDKKEPEKGKLTVDDLKPGKTEDTEPDPEEQEKLRKKDEEEKAKPAKAEGETEKKEEKPKRGRPRKQQ